MIKLNLNENFICRIWEEKSYYSEIKTTDGNKVEILNYGEKNYDAGPDYKFAKVKIGNVIYSGSIEIHKTFNDWHQHKHKNDNKYNDLILHVVFYANEPEENSGNPVVKKSRTVPTIILSEFLTKSIHTIWKEIINNPSPTFRLPCFPESKRIPSVLKNNWINNLGIDRLIFKSERINFRLEEISDDITKKIYWEQVLFEFICEALGYSKNKEQFLKLSQNINLNEIKKLKLDLSQIESMLYGLSGFLYDLKFKDEYISKLKSDWTNLKDILKKEIMNKSEWNFFRLRPANFPSVRIAYASALLFAILNKDFFKHIISVFENSENVMKQLEKSFSDIKVSEYWNTHYNFGKKSKSENRNIGSERIKDIISNIILPLIILYSVKFSKEDLRKKTEYFFCQTKHKKTPNEITKVMEEQLDTGVNSLAAEQGLIQLHNFYCVKCNCNVCEIGKIIFNEKPKLDPMRIILY